MSSTSSGSFQQPLLRQPLARRSELAGEHVVEVQKLSHQAVEGATIDQIRDSSEGQGRNSSSMNSPMLDVGKSSIKHSRTTSKTSNASILSSPSDVDLILPVQFPPKPVQDPLWRHHNATWRPSTSLIVSNNNASETRMQHTEAPAASRVYPQSRKLKQLPIM
jgi:hypothetical protein